MITWNFKVDKPICFVCHGHSVKELIERIDEFRKFDVLWGSLNDAGFFASIQPLDIYVKYSISYGSFNLGKHNLVKSDARGNSLLEFIYQCDENNVKDLFIFGADGYSDIPREYYQKEKSGRGISQHKKDCEHFNTHYQKVKTNVFNCSINSHYTPIKRITYDQCLKSLSLCQR